MIEYRDYIPTSLLRILRLPTCGVTIVTRTITTRLIVEQLPNLNSRKSLALKPNMDPERSLWSSFSKKLMPKRHLKPEKTASSKKRKEEHCIPPLY
jgi:hypothetical protein